MSLRRRLRIHLCHMHARLYAGSGGRLGGSVGGHRVLLLTTTGRRSGERVRTPVQYEVVDGETLLVAAGGGSPRPPAWWRNVEADPHVSVQIGGDERPAFAATLPAAERAERWPRLCERNRHLEPLQRKAGRELPVVRVTWAS